ncbi:hypothetical protein COLO4_07324 [Corchorus olitorius]|uniref:Uncharacterized protein n=1 Tax=Corchorus olitorius TaxID=93759 RepID=A0A1R3KK51_9ROSI|nr:hypothetical protein COLO4_07324 [Corchorus olitorius]
MACLKFRTNQHLAVVKVFSLLLTVLSYILSFSFMENAVLVMKCYEFAQIAIFL